jgi:hypothetical protein
VRVDTLNRPKLTIGYCTFSIWCGHLHAIASRKCPLGLAVDCHALQTAWIVRDGSLVIRTDRHLIRLPVHALDAGVIASLDAEGLAAAAIAHDITHLIPLRPLSIGASDLLSRHQDGEMVLVPMDVALALHRLVNHVVEVLTRPVVRRDDERRVWVFDVLVRDRRQTFLARADCMHAALVVKPFDSAMGFSAGQLFNDRLQLWISLPHDLIKMHRVDTRFLELVIRSARIDGFMLAHVADKQQRSSGRMRSRNVCICLVLAKLDSSRT